MGDSLTAAGKYETQLESLLGSADWHTNNKGISGQTTDQMLDRFSADVISPSDGEYVVIWGGINDVNSSVDAVTIEANLQGQYTLGHDAGLKVVAISIEPEKGYGSWSAPRQTVIDDVNTWMNGTAIDIDKFIDIYSLLEDPANPDALLPAYDNGGHLHLSTAGYYAVGTEIYGSVLWVPSLTFPNNFTPGATYHYRACASNTISQINGTDQTFTFVMPNVTTGGATQSHNQLTLTGNVTSMGNASDTYGYFKWGYDTGALNYTSSNSTVTEASDYSQTITFNPTYTVYYRAYTDNGGVTSNGTTKSITIARQTAEYSGVQPLMLIIPLLIAAVAIAGIFWMLSSGLKTMKLSGLNATVMLDAMIALVLTGVVLFCISFMVEIITQVLARTA
jgi:lysophospholipase L1-like esterase